MGRTSYLLRGKNGISVLPPTLHKIQFQIYPILYFKDKTGHVLENNRHTQNNHVRSEGLGCVWWWCTLTPVLRRHGRGRGGRSSVNLKLQVCTASSRTTRAALRVLVSKQKRQASVHPRNHRKGKINHTLEENISNPLNQQSPGAVHSQRPRCSS